MLSKSRYYDPQVARFINADEQINKGILGTNLFSYCVNNPIACYDPNGRDAMFLYNPDGVFGFGHIAIAVQNEYNDWWFFQWAVDIAIFERIPTKYIKSSIGFLVNINKWWLNQITFKKAIYITGNTCSTFQTCADLYTSYMLYRAFVESKPLLSWFQINPLYDLALFNCAQACLFALSQSFPEVRKWAGIFGVYDIFPSNAYSNCLTLSGVIATEEMSGKDINNYTLKAWRKFFS